MFLFGGRTRTNNTRREGLSWSETKPELGLNEISMLETILGNTIYGLTEPGERLASIVKNVVA